jgi:hypothetical protein
LVRAAMDGILRKAQDERRWVPGLPVNNPG